MGEKRALESHQAPPSLDIRGGGCLLIALPKYLTLLSSLENPFPDLTGFGSRTMTSLSWAPKEGWNSMRRAVQSQALSRDRTEDTLAATSLEVIRAAKEGRPGNVLQGSAHSASHLPQSRN